VEDFGGDMVYVPNRCILCTRCVRFMDDVAHESTLAVAERGDRAVIAKFEGQDLTHPWAGNVVELCPVGALLSKDFLNKARSWDLDRSASICPNCTQGCNAVLETRDNVVVRMRPRPNEAVNRFFLCDEGRLDYRWLNRRDRAEYPLVRRGDALVPTEWDLAIEEAGEQRGDMVTVGVDTCGGGPSAAAGVAATTAPGPSRAEHASSRWSTSRWSGRAPARSAPFRIAAAPGRPRPTVPLPRPARRPTHGACNRRRDGELDRVRAGGLTVVGRE